MSLRIYNKPTVCSKLSVIASVFAPGKGEKAAKLAQEAVRQLARTPRDPFQLHEQPSDISINQAGWLSSIASIGKTLKGNREDLIRGIPEPELRGARMEQLMTTMEEAVRVEEYLLDHPELLASLVTKPGLELIPQYASTNPERPSEIKVVLIVDDDPSVLRALARIMRKIPGLEVITIDSTNLKENPVESQVMKMIDQTKFDLILMDGNMPGISGDKLIEKLRIEKGFIGYIAGISDDLGRTAAMKSAGADFSLLEGMDTKPDLGERIRSMFVRN